MVSELDGKEVVRYRDNPANSLGRIEDSVLITCGTAFDEEPIRRVCFGRRPFTENATGSKRTALQLHKGHTINTGEMICGELCAVFLQAPDNLLPEECIPRPFPTLSIALI